MRKMPVGAVKVVRQIRAALATFFPARAEHEVIDDQLTATVKEIGQRFFAIRPIEYVILVYFNPWQLASMPAHFIAQPRQFLLTRQQVLARNEPFVSRH